MTLNEYKHEKLTLDDYAQWEPTGAILDIFKCSKCGHRSEGVYQYVMSGKKIWDYPNTCPGCNRTMISIETKFKGE